MPIRLCTRHRARHLDAKVEPRTWRKLPTEQSDRSARPRYRGSIELVRAAGEGGG